MAHLFPEKSELFHSTLYEPNGWWTDSRLQDTKKGRNSERLRPIKLLKYVNFWLRVQDLNLRPSSYESDGVSAYFM